MHRQRASSALVTLLALSWLLSPAAAHAATPAFTVSATNVIMPASGMGTSTVTATSENSYAGRLVIACDSANSSMGAHLPLCFGHPVTGLAVAANKSAQLQLYLVPYGQAPPPVSSRTSGWKGEAPLALAGALLLGFGLRRRARKLGWFTLAAALFAASAGITACGGGAHGTFTYNVVATDSATSASTTATFTVTLP